MSLTWKQVQSSGNVPKRQTLHWQLGRTSAQRHLQSVRERWDRLPQMHKPIFVDAVTPVLVDARPNDPRMHLTGTLRRHGADYLLEQRLDVNAGPGPHWTTPRVHRVMATDDTRSALPSLVDQVVTIIGTAGCGGERNRTSIVLDSIQPVDSSSSVR